MADIARRFGFDSVRINNVKDVGKYSNHVPAEGSIARDIGIFFNESQIKSADAVTYDDQGKVIKPSERFKDQKADIRWSKAGAQKNIEGDFELPDAIDTGKTGSGRGRPSSRISIDEATDSVNRDRE